jgi:hypothetical protein
MRILLGIFALAILTTVAGAQSPKPVTFCEVAHNPPAYDKQELRMPVAFSVAFEDFSIWDPSCKSNQGIWAAFGGDVPGLTASTSNDTSRTPGTDLVFHGASYSIKKDADFRKLYALLAAKNGEKPLYRATAMVTGVFFAGPDIAKRDDGTTEYTGYGHLGCCSLFIITSVGDVSSKPPARLTLRGTVLRPDGKPAQGIEVLSDIQGGSPPLRQSTTTNAHGAFSFDVAGQLLRVNDPRYRPVALEVVPGGAPIATHLEAAPHSDWILPACSPASLNSHSRVGFRVKFSMPPEFRSEKEPREVGDAYAIGLAQPEGFRIIDDTRAVVITNDSGPQDDPEPRAAGDTYKLRWIKDSDGQVIGMDMEGLSPKYGPWRNAIFYGHEYAAYISDEKDIGAALRDSVIDSACIDSAAQN